jgi:predicted RNA-binding protein with PUA-like domain
MAYWLFKSEPGAWSWEDQLKEGKKGAEWDGVRNHQANNNMKEMKLGDKGFFYHSVNEKRIVGIVEVCKLWYLDPSDEKNRGFGMVDVRALETLPKPVTLADVKADERLHHLALVTNSRLSVQPVDAKAWKIICRMGDVKP